MQSIIDLSAIIQRPAWNKENICSQRNSPPYQLNMRKKRFKWKERGWRGGEEWRLFQSSSRRKQLFSCPAFSTVLFLSGQQQEWTNCSKTNCKELFLYSLCAFSCTSSLEDGGSLSMGVCLCMCVCLAVQGWYSTFPFRCIKGAINSALLLLAECNT